MLSKVVYKPLPSVVFDRQCMDKFLEVQTEVSEEGLWELFLIFYIIVEADG